MLNEGGTRHNPSCRGGRQWFFSVVSFCFFPTGFIESHVIYCCVTFSGETWTIIYLPHIRHNGRPEKTIPPRYSLMSERASFWLKDNLRLTPAWMMLHETATLELPAWLADCSPSCPVSSSQQLLLLISSWGETCESGKFQELLRFCKLFTCMASCFLYFWSLMNLLSFHGSWGCCFKIRGKSYTALTAQFTLNNVWHYELWRTYNVKHPSL